MIPSLYGSPSRTIDPGVPSWWDEESLFVFTVQIIIIKGNFMKLVPSKQLLPVGKGCYGDESL
jgi:hypothetical protein